MSSPFVAEIRMWACNFAPTGWAFCNGQLLPISQNTALFSLVGTMYGGDGKSTFALPDFQDAVPIGQGDSTTGTSYFVGEQAGTSTVTLIQSEIPFHTHTVNTVSTIGDNNAPSPDVSLARSHNASAYQDNTTQQRVMLSPQAVSITGASFPHNNMQPYLVVNFCIALQGVFPARG